VSLPRCCAATWPSCQNCLNRWPIALFRCADALGGGKASRRHKPNRVYWLTQHGTALPNVRARGQRGLTLERIEQIEELRRRFQSLNQTLRRDIAGKPPIRRDEAVPDPCPDLLEKLDRIKEQRINQTAHMILAEALGVKLARPPANKADLRQECDQHGVYEKLREPVDFIVIEDLSRYRASQGRAPRENSRLMKLCHRGVRNKLKQLCEPFGIPVLETPAAWLSRFCSRSGVAASTRGSASGIENGIPWSWYIKRLELHRKNPGKHPLSEDAKTESEQIEQIFADLDAANKDVHGERPNGAHCMRPKPAARFSFPFASGLPIRTTKIAARRRPIGHQCRHKPRFARNSRPAPVEHPSAAANTAGKRRLFNCP